MGERQEDLSRTAETIGVAEAELIRARNGKVAKLCGCRGARNVAAMSAARQAQQDLGGQRNAHVWTMTGINSASSTVATSSDPRAGGSVLSPLHDPIDAVIAAITGENAANAGETQPGVGVIGAAVAVFVAPVVNFIVEPVAVGAGIPNVLASAIGQAGV